MVLNSKNQCQLCSKHYKLSRRGKCLRSTCEGLDKNGKCIKCTEGFYLLDSSCEKIPIDYCSEGDEESCTECFHYAPTLDNGECILDKLISGCNRVNDADETKCLQCSMGYELSIDHTKCELTHCTNREEVCYQCENGYFIADNGRACLNETIEEYDTDYSSFLVFNCLYCLIIMIFFL